MKDVKISIEDKYTKLSIIANKLFTSVCSETSVNTKHKAIMTNKVTKVLTIYLVLLFEIHK